MRLFGSQEELLNDFIGCLIEFKEDVFLMSLPFVFYETLYFHEFAFRGYRRGSYHYIIGEVYKERRTHEIESGNVVFLKFFDLKTNQVFFISKQDFLDQDKKESKYIIHPGEL